MKDHNNETKLFYYFISHMNMTVVHVAQVRHICFLKMVIKRSSLLVYRFS